MRTDKKELFAVVIDILPMGHGDVRRPQFKKEPLLQAIGTDQFKLLELVPKTLDLQLHDMVYIGDKERDKIERVKRRIGYSDLTNTAKAELPFAVERIVKEHEERFVDFFNKAISITPKLHMLHLIPGIGKKLMWEILEAREQKPFVSFSDISERIKALPHPDQMIVKRVMEEIEDPDVKYHLFTLK
jgi:putative nucleotide binding protein